MPVKLAIIGGGIFGAVVALKLAEAGLSATIFERREGLLLGTSLLGNRLHYGFHYPRDEETARQCLRGYEEFRREFEAAIRPGVSNAYFIASGGSLTSPDDYLLFCRRLGLPFQIVEPGAFRPTIENVSLGMLTEEVLYDVAVLRRLLTERLMRAGVEVRLGAGVDALRRLKGGGFAVETSRGDVASFDVVVNCSYAEVNHLTAQLGHAIETRQYEYAAVPIMEIDWPVEASVTILDGPFVSLLPYGPRGQYLVAHVADQIIAREDTRLMNPAWCDARTSPFASTDRQLWLESYLGRCCEFLPDLRAGRVLGFLKRPRMVVAGREDTDARRSFVTVHEPGYMSVFSGKIDHCFWIAEEVRSKLMSSSLEQPEEADRYRPRRSLDRSSGPSR